MSETAERPHMPTIPVIHATAVNYLLDGDEHAVAQVLIAAQLSAEWAHRPASHDIWMPSGEAYVLLVTLTGPRFVYDRIEEDRDESRDRIWAALRAALPAPWVLESIRAQLEPIDIGAGWREELLERARGLGIDNQGQPIENRQVRTWNNLRFRSESEVRIAQVLDEAGALYWPNCRSRLGERDARRNLEADFLVCWKGKWGILEVDGEPFHPPERRTQEQERDRMFQHHGVLVVQHYTADRCFQHPREVVKDFIRLLKGS